MSPDRHVGTALLFTAAMALAVQGTSLRDGAPGPRGESPESWPAGSGLPHGRDATTLVVFLHPRCPCSQATVGELALLLARFEGRARVYVVFPKPEGAPADWTDTQLCRDVRALGGVATHGDDQGREARLFGARTSGHVLVYDRDGALRYSGGITGARATAGDNRGRDAIEAILGGRCPERASCPVFGCSLLGDAQAKDVAR